MRCPHIQPAILAAALLLSSSPDARALDFQFDYTYDTTNFFNTQAKKDMLALAASTFAGFTDNLAAITPDVDNTWNPVFKNPTTGSNFTGPQVSVPAGTVIVYVGARDLPGSTLGEGGPGGFEASGITQDWFDAIQFRGQSGATDFASTSTDFGPWGGSLAFDSQTNWNFGFGQPTNGGQSDFLSVAIHELGHMLGFLNDNPSFAHWRSGSTFVGPVSKSKFGNAAIPLGTADLSHWANGTNSTINGQRAQETAMDPSLTQGTRKLFTALDFAGLDDVGWDVRLPADLNNSGRVDRDDYALIDRGFNKHLTGWSNGDLNLDGVIDAKDYQVIDLWYFNQTTSLDPQFLADRAAQFGPEYLSSLQSLVPDPATPLSAILPSAALLSSRRRRTATRHDLHAAAA